MYKILFSLIYLLFTISPLIAKELTPFEKHGKLQVIGKHLCDSTGTPVQLRGLSTHGIQYFPELYSRSLFESLAQDWKCDIIRISSYVNEGGWAEGNYLENPDFWKEYIDTLVSWGEEEGIYVLIDWHMLYPGDPNYYKDVAKEFWEYMAEKHGAKSNVLFEICNEPNDRESWAEDGYTVTWNMIKNYAEEIIPTIRSKSENIIIVGTPYWASRPHDVIDNTLDYSNTMYTMHFYAADHGESYRENVKKALDSNIPVFVTEFGTTSASGGDSYNFDSSREWLDFLEENKISWINWNISYDYLSSAIFEKYKNPEDQKLAQKGYFNLTSEEKDQLYNAETINYDNTYNFTDTAILKESGEWILKELQTPVAHTSLINPSFKTSFTPVSFFYETGKLHIIGNYTEELSISITNLAGQSIYKEDEVKNSAISTGDISTGLYIVTSKMKSGYTHSQKLLIK